LCPVQISAQGASARDQEDVELDVELVARVRSGDREAFAVLYDAHHATVFRYVFRRVADDRYLAEDLTSETFLRALWGMDAFARRCRGIDVWLITIARNLTADHLTSARRRCEVPVRQVPEPAKTADSVEDEVVEMLEHHRLRAAVAALAAQKRTVVSIRYRRETPNRSSAAPARRSGGHLTLLPGGVTADPRSTRTTLRIRKGNLA
jgi:RNA polymerase sigma-70 factor (ECF subfamily)